MLYLYKILYDKVFVMNFSEKLIEYMKLLNCNTNELSKESGLSYTLINRYMNNTRKPKEDSKFL